MDFPSLHVIPLLCVLSAPIPAVMDDGLFAAMPAGRLVDLDDVDLGGFEPRPRIELGCRGMLLDNMGRAGDGLDRVGLGAIWKG